MDCFHKVKIKLESLPVIKQSTFLSFFPNIHFHQKTSSQLQGRNGFLNTLLLPACFFPRCRFLPYPNASIKFILHFLHLKNQTHITLELTHRLQMEKGAGGGDDPARAVGMCDRFLTFLTKNLSLNRQKNITEGPRNGGNGSNHRNHAEEEDDDEYTVKIEKAEFGFSHEEEGHRSFTATILEERSTDVRASDQKKEAMVEAAGHEVAAAEAAASAVQEKVRKSVTIKEDREVGAGDKDKKSQLKKKQASLSSSSNGGQVGAGGGEDAKPPPRWGFRLRMPAIPRVPSNINEKSTNFIQERKRGFGAGGRQEK